jgi:para-aminobenzoate synthetase/4-amino-4-deoxychorismate lyase
MAAGHFDAVFLNEKGELTEGARTNVFVERGGVLMTPPLAAGLPNV